MAELVFRSVNIRRTNRSIYFWIADGWIDAIPAVRGVDTVVPGRHGRTERNRMKDYRRVVLNGSIKAATTAAFYALLQEMDDIIDPSLAPADLVVADGYKGLGGGVTATLVARTLNFIGEEQETELHRLYTWELECTENPPEWTIT